jgi:hypothetical protein
LLREVGRKINLLARVAECFSDSRCASISRFSQPEMPAHRIYGLALGYDGLNDHK